MLVGCQRGQERQALQGAQSPACPRAARHAPSPNRKPRIRGLMSTISAIIPLLSAAAPNRDIAGNVGAYSIGRGMGGKRTIALLASDQQRQGNPRVVRSVWFPRLVH